MAVFVKAPDNTWHGMQASPLLSGKPWVKVNNVWVAGTFAYRKVAGVWQEIYPMLPGTATALSANAIYRNDRIEIDFTWTAPVGGFTTTYYIVKVYFNGALYGSYTINAPTVSMTLTNSTNSALGFQPYAGQGLTFSVQCFTAGNVGGSLQVSGTTTVPNMPTPPTPTGLAVSVANNDLTESWNHTNDNRTSYFRLEVTIDGATTGYNIGKAASVSGSWFPYGSNSKNGGSWSVRVAAVGVNGLYSAWTSSVARNFVSDPQLYNQLVSGGVFSTAFVGDTVEATGVDLWYQYGTGGGWNYYGQSGTLTGSVVAAPGSNGWARDNSTQFRWLARCVKGADAGRVVGGTWCRKMALPYIIHAQDSATYNNGGWQGDSGGTYVFQGWATSVGYYWGYGFYGQQFYDQLNAAVIGYNMYLSADTDFRVWMCRDNDNPPYYANYNGLNGGTQLRFWLHDSRNRGEATNGFYNQTVPASGAFNKGEMHFVFLPHDFFYRMRDAQSWGIGILDTDNTVQFLPPNGTSMNMTRTFGHTQIQSGEYCWSIYIYHSN